MISLFPMPKPGCYFSFFLVLFPTPTLDKLFLYFNSSPPCWIKSQLCPRTPGLPALWYYTWFLEFLHINGREAFEDILPMVGFCLCGLCTTGFDLGKRCIWGQERYISWKAPSPITTLVKNHITWIAIGTIFFSKFLYNKQIGAAKYCTVHGSVLLTSIPSRSS